jgi:hypothetical protein
MPNIRIGSTGFSLSATLFLNKTWSRQPVFAVCQHQMWSRQSVFVACQQHMWGRRSFFVVCLPASTAPWPTLLDVSQSSLHRIILDISNHVFELPRRTYPMIVRFILPKRQPGPPQLPVRLATRPALEPSHNRWPRTPGLENNMYVVGLDDPAVQRVEAARCFTIQECLLNHPRYAGFSKPERTAFNTFKPLVPRKKRRASGILHGQNIGTARRHRPGKAPRHKDCDILGNPMWQSPAVMQHSSTGRPQKTMVCPTPSIASVLEREKLSLKVRHAS